MQEIGDLEATAANEHTTSDEDSSSESDYDDEVIDDAAKEATTTDDSITGSDNNSDHGATTLVQIDTADNIADIHTKPLASTTFQRHRAHITYSVDDVVADKPRA